MAGKGVRRLNVVATSVLLLASCAGPTSVAERVTRGLPNALSEAQLAEITMGDPAVFWLDTGKSIALVTFGSSSCPAVVSSMEAIGTDALKLRIDSSGGSGPCTADLTATTHELMVPISVTQRPVSLTLRYPEGDASPPLVLD